MIDPKDIRPLTEFQRNAKASIARLQKNKRPEVLTVKGKAALVVIDATAYFNRIGILDEWTEIEAVRQALAEVDAGRSRPLDEVMRELRAKYGLRAKPRAKKSA